MKRLNIAALIVLAVLLVAGWTYQASQPVKWEYRTVTSIARAQDLNSYGVEGWELIAIHDSHDALGLKTTFYFKRPLVK